MRLVPGVRVTGVRASLLVTLIATGAACQGNGTFFAAAVDGGFFGGGGFGGFGGGGFSGGGFGGISGVGGFGGDAFDAGIDGGTGIPWISPFPNMGAPGFGTSTDTLCAEIGIDGNAIDVWSDQRGVFALVTGIGHSMNDADGGPNDCGPNGCPMERLLQHDGTGWRLLNEQAFDEQVGSNSVGLRGVPNGLLFAHRSLIVTSPRNRCSITGYDTGPSTCWRELGQVDSLFMVDATRGYALLNNGNPALLLRFDGTDWHDDTPTASGRSRALWADTSQVLVLNGAEPFRVFQTADGATWNALGGAPTGRGTALWATSSTDIWVGAEDSRIWHFDGQAWQQMSSLGGVTCGEASPIRGIWGSGNFIYFHSATALQRWNGASVESLANWSCAFSSNDSEIQDLWGNSEDEVFLAIKGGPSDDCGGAIVVRFDGTQFHRM